MAVRRYQNRAELAAEFYGTAVELAKDGNKLTFNLRVQDVLYEMNKTRDKKVAPSQVYGRVLASQDQFNIETCARLVESAPHDISSKLLKSEDPAEFIKDLSAKRTEFYIEQAPYLLKIFPTIIDLAEQRPAPLGVDADYLDTWQHDQMLDSLTRLPVVCREWQATQVEYDTRNIHDRVMLGDMVASREAAVALDALARVQAVGLEYSSL